MPVSKHDSSVSNSGRPHTANGPWILQRVEHLSIREHAIRVGKCIATSPLAKEHFNLPGRLIKPSLLVRLRKFLLEPEGMPLSLSINEKITGLRTKSSQFAVSGHLGTGFVILKPPARKKSRCLWIQASGSRMSRLGSVASSFVKSSTVES